MRVTTDLFVSALVRRAFSAGAYAAIVKRGATEAGAVFVICRGRDGLSRLLGPASQADYDEARPSERGFTEMIAGAEEQEIETRLDKERRFDPDLWIVELEAAPSLVDELVPTVSR